MNQKISIYIRIGLIANLIYLIYLIHFFKNNSYLPAPFFYDKYDTFMDFYNTLYWSNREDIYKLWRTVYPPLNFLLLKIYQFFILSFELEGIKAGSIRALFPEIVMPVLLIYCLLLALSVSISFKKNLNNKYKILASIFFALSPEFLFALERANLIILCLPLIGLYINSKNNKSKAIFLAILVNLKPYFIVIYIFELINQRRKLKNNLFIKLMPALSLAILLITGILVNQDFYRLPTNLMKFGVNVGDIFSVIEIINFPSSIIAFTHVLGNMGNIYKYVIYISLYIYIFLILIIIYRKEINGSEITIFSIIFLTNFSISAGGYSLMLYIPLIPKILDIKDNKILALVFLIFIGVIDMIPLYSVKEFSQYSYLSGEYVLINQNLTVGSIMRPILNMFILALFYHYLKNKYVHKNI